jgi:hypothetical protein
MRIAFDLDGVLADLHAAYALAAVRLFPELDRSAIERADVGASPPDPAAEPQDGGTPEPVAPIALSRRQSEAVWSHLTSIDNFWEQLDEIENGVIRRLALVADERRWDVLFITSRPSSAGATVQRKSQRWLQARGFPLPSVYVVHGNRGRVADALDLDVVVDDRPSNCLDVASESRAGAVLLWRGPEETVPESARRLGIVVAPTVHACLDTLIEAQAATADDSFLDRLRKLFRLRTRKAPNVLRRT